MGKYGGEVTEKSDEEKNREYWNLHSEEYQALHASQLNEMPLTWGVWSVPEAELHVLGDVASKQMLELGCGGAQWSAFLAMRDARPVGLDFSEQQLWHARRFLETHGVAFPLVAGSAEKLPFAADSFDIVFCDHGAMSFADPERVIPEVARVLRRNGLFAFNRSTPFHACCYDPELDAVGERLSRSYFESRIDAWGTVDFNPTYGEWLRMFQRNGFVVEDLIELRPPESATTTYDGFVSYEWARKWPAENIWKLRKTVKAT